MRYKTMLKRFVTEKKYRIKDRMMLIIRIKYDGMDIRKVAKSLGKSGLGGGVVQMACKIQTSGL